LLKATSLEIHVEIASIRNSNGPRGAHFQSRNYESALRDYNAAIKLAPGYSWNYGLRAFVKARLGQDDSAMRDAEYLVKNNFGDFGFPYAIRAIVHAYAGRKAEALLDIKRAKTRRGDRQVQGFQESTASLIKDLELSLRQPKPDSQDTTILVPSLPSPIGPSSKQPNIPGNDSVTIAVRRQRIPPVPELIAGKSVTKTGSGFFIDAVGRIITNEHVLNECAALTVLLPNAQVVGAVKIQTDAELDLGLIGIPYAWPNWARLSFTNIKLGEPVVALGFPLQAILGTQLNLTTGITSSMSGPNGDQRLFQISAPIQPGNSGGPVLNSSGELVGVVVATLGGELIASAVGVTPQNVNFAIRHGEVERFLANIPITVERSESEALTIPSIGDLGAKFTVAISCYN
jgi:S1-C subfamily serine protease